MTTEIVHELGASEDKPSAYVIEAITVQHELGKKSITGKDSQPKIDESAPGITKIDEPAPGIMLQSPETTEAQQQLSEMKAIQKPQQPKLHKPVKEFSKPIQAEKTPSTTTQQPKI